jgi:hypothetical protein
MTDYVSLDSNGFALATGYVKTYLYDRSGVFLSEQDEWVTVGTGVSAGSTATAPASASTGYVAVFENNTWSLAEDHRGEIVYSTTDMSESTVDYVGPITAGYTVLKPATVYDVWTNNAWVTNVTAQTAAAVSAALEKQATLLATAKSTISVWQTELLLGVISDADKTSLTSWISYIKALQSVNTSSPSTIAWPSTPTS